MGIASERSIHSSIYPLFPGKGSKFKDMIDSVPILHNKSCITHGIWDARSFMIMDIIANSFIQNVKTTTTNLKEIKTFKEEIEEFIASGLNPNKIEYKIKINDTYLREKFYFFQNYTSAEVFNFIRLSSECKFKLNYKVKVFNKELNDNEYYVYNGTESWCNWFNLETVNLKVSKNGDVLEREYKIYLNTVLAQLFIMNLRSLNINWINPELYELSNYSQLIYKCLLRNSQSRVLYITTCDITNKLNLVDRSDTFIINTIKSSLDELKKNSFIKSYVPKGKIEKMFTYKIFK